MLDGEREPDWRALARPGQTLVLYMGVGSIAKSMAQLIGNGLAAVTPVAVVENGTTDQQRVLRGTLATIADRALEAKIRAPATIIVGATAGLGQELEWFAAASDPSRANANGALSWRSELPVVNDSTIAQ
jgi:siroheme synthase